MVLTSAKGDIASANNNAENILLQDTNTDWTIESKNIYSRRPTGYSQNGGILSYPDNDSYIKLVYTANSGIRNFAVRPTVIEAGTVVLVKECDGYQTTAAFLNMEDIIKDDNTLILKLEKKGSLYTASCSANGKEFKTIGAAEIVLKDVKAGMITCKGATNFMGFPGMRQRTNQPEVPFEIAYDYFHIVNEGAK